MPLALCLAAGSLATALALGTDGGFTLAWTHSIEKIRWEEDYRAETVASDGGGGQVLLLRLTEARIRGSGAGMEPPEGARLDEHGVWHYVPKLAPLPVLRITQSQFTQGYELCRGGECLPLTELLSGLADGVVELRACAG